MLPIIALIGRPNVGKSTLFNCVTRTRDAIVADYAGLTRDRQYGIGVLGGRYIVVDTGGIGEENEPIETLMAKQTRMGIDEADVIIWLVEATKGLTASDEFIAQELRKKSKPLLIAVNKTDGIDPDQAASEFFTLGMGQPSAIAAAHGRGVTDLMTRALELLPPEMREEEEEDEDESMGTRIAFIGKPNVGKSTLVNRMLGEDRVVVSEVSGTTRDSIYIPFSRNDKPFTLIDTAGIRRRARVNEAIEKFSIIKTIKAIDSADVVINVIDAREGITDQDMHLMGLALNQGRAMVLAINKWDGMTEEDRERVKAQIDLKLPFLDFVEKYFISALHGSNVGHLYEAVERAYTSATLDLSTSQLTRVLEDALKRHQPPLVGGRRIKLRYAHQGGRKPPVIVLHGNQTNKVPGSYRRYLENFFRKALHAVGTPLRIEFKTGDNPFEVKKSRISASQQKIIKEAKLKKRH